jgi:hypothetical protein
VSDDKDDIPFEDSPPRPAGAEGARSAEGAGSGGGAEDSEDFEGAARAAHADTADQARKGPESGKPDTDRAEHTAENTAGGAAGASEERTPPGPGSTGPTGVREDLGTLADEARKLWATLEARVVAPAVQSYPEVARHLGAAGREVAAALRSAVRGSEQSWRTGGPDGEKARQQEKITVERVDRIDPPEQKNRD